MQKQSEYSSSRVQPLTATVLLSTAFVGLVALLVLVGWQLDIAFFKSVLPNLATMKPNTAVCFGFSALAVWLSRTEVSRRQNLLLVFLLVAVVILIAATVEVEYLFKWNAGIDQLLFTDAEHQIGHFPPGRFAPGTGFCFLLISGSLLLLDSRPRESHFFTIAAILVALISLIGYIDNLPTLYGAGRYTSLALHTIINFLVLGVALLACRPERGLTKLLLSSTTSPVSSTHVLFIAAIVGPLVVGALVLRIQHMGAFGSEFTLSLFTVILILLSVAIIWVTEGERQKVESQRLATARALSLSEERLRLALSSGSIGIWEFNPTTGAREWDARCRSIFGLPTGSVIDAETILSRAHPHDRDMIRECMSTYFDASSDGRFELEYRIFWSDGTLRYIYEQGRSIFELDGPNSRAVRAVGTLQDITALKRGEQELRRVNEELEQFAYAAAHDLQEPLRNVCLATQMVTRSYRGRIDGEADRLLQFAVESGQRMLAMLKGLLAYSRALAYEEDALPWTDANLVFSETILNLQLLIEEKSAQITSDILPSVRMRQIHLLQIFQNLIANALKHCGPQPPEITVSSAVHGGLCTFLVKDNGIGIPAQFHHRVFLVFKRLNANDLTGTGLGLALCKRIVEFYGGKIWIESDVGKGATFLFTAPLAGSHQVIVLPTAAAS